MSFNLPCGFPIAANKTSSSRETHLSASPFWKKRCPGFRLERSHRKPRFQLTALKPVLTVLSIFPSLDLLIATLYWQRQTTCGFLIDSNMSDGNPIGYSESSNIWKASELVLKKTGIWLCVSVFYYWVHHMIWYALLVSYSFVTAFPKITKLRVCLKTGYPKWSIIIVQEKDTILVVLFGFQSDAGCSISHSIPMTHYTSNLDTSIYSSIYLP